MEKMTWLYGILEAEICKQDMKFGRANTNYSDLSDKFGIGEAIAHDIVVQTIAAIVKCLRYNIQFLETAAEVRVMAEDFQQITKTHLPNVAGAIDCTHFEIIQPVGPDGVYDAQKWFLSIGWPGSRLMVTEAEYNQQHYLAQIVIEQAFELLKMKFRCKDQAKVFTEHHQRLLHLPQLLD
ncbi:hypothetical protein SELMODRAFT_418500 [Selaginella moellendorffii]|uniref:DDE Tnp4 domain-containing protein n=1 Tax=Selaginella moellendorffii TaxID=88036 RepID=D8S5X2_SELML|nr:hypothetical protein SELMODRAFT_418500 [Selaginella moellendorffii]